MCCRGCLTGFLFPPLKTTFPPSHFLEASEPQETVQKLQLLTSTIIKGGVQDPIHGHILIQSTRQDKIPIDASILFLANKFNAQVQPLLNRELQSARSKYKDYCMAHRIQKIS